MKGYLGKILIIDLSTGEIRKEKVEDKVYENFLSGSGLGLWYLYTNIPEDAKPFGKENILGFTSGLLTGTGSVLTGRFMVMCKSPLTGGIGEANCGGYFSIAIKQCGYDAIFVKGKSEKPCYIYIDNKNVEILDATLLQGKDSVETEEKLIEEYKENKIPAVVTIGEAGEKLSLISGICTDKGRIAARSGVGAVMGSKNLKAMVLCGSRAISGQNPEEIKAISKQLSDKIRHLNLPAFVKSGAFALMNKMPPYSVPMNGMLSAMIMKKWGTSGTSSMCVATGDAPIKNWAGSVKDYKRKDYRKIDGDKIIKREYKKYHCYSCVLGCGGICNIENVGSHSYKNTHKPEYETQMAFGGLILNTDLDTIFYINELLNRAGMDTISAAHCVAMATECVENGIISEKMLNGIELRWGNSKAIVKLLELMIKREGIGEIFADGTKVAAEKLGLNAADYAIHAGGQECGMHDGRGDPLLAVHYAADATPGRHTTGSSQYYSCMHLWKKVSWAPQIKVHPKSKEYIPSEEEAAKSVAMAYYKRLLDGVGGCFFGALLGVTNFQMFEWLNHATGWEKTPDEYMETGKRLYTLRQLFNLKHKINPWDYRLHKRLAGEPPLKEGPLKNKTLLIDDMMKEHWKFCDWESETGIPTKETIEKLGLSEIVGGDNNE